MSMHVTIESDMSCKQRETSDIIFFNFFTSPFFTTQTSMKSMYDVTLVVAVVV